MEPTASRSRESSSRLSSLLLVTVTVAAAVVASRFGSAQVSPPQAPVTTIVIGILGLIWLVLKGGSP